MIYRSDGWASQQEFNRVGRVYRARPTDQRRWMRVPDECVPLNKDDEDEERPVSLWLISVATFATTAALWIAWWFGG